MYGSLQWGCEQMGGLWSAIDSLFIIYHMWHDIWYFVNDQHLNTTQLYCPVAQNRRNSWETDFRIVWRGSSWEREVKRRGELTEKRSRKERQEAPLTSGPLLSFSGPSIAALIPLSQSLRPPCQRLGFIHACRTTAVEKGAGGDWSCHMWHCKPLDPFLIPCLCTGWQQSPDTAVICGHVDASSTLPIKRKSGQQYFYILFLYVVSLLLKCPRDFVTTNGQHSHGQEEDIVPICLFSKRKVVLYLCCAELFSLTKSHTS